MAQFQVTVAGCNDYARLGEAFEELREKAGLKTFAQKVSGKKVLVKPNMLSAWEPEAGITTHPELVRATVDWLQAAGARVTVGDNCGMGGYGINERAAKVTGIREASQGTFVNIAKDLKEIEVQSRFFQKVIVSKAVLEADYVVNLPKLKTHALSHLTLGIKNMFGMLAGASKSRVHAAAQTAPDFGEALVDIFQLRPPDLTIVDGVVGMEGNGPSTGRVRKIGYLFAGENTPAVDGVIARLAGIPPDKVDHLRVAAERGLGPQNLDQVEILGEAKPIPRFKLPSTLPRLGLVSFFVNQFLYQPALRSRLVLEPEKCSGCKLCLENCPASAMSWREGFPVMDQEKCIRCFCCAELCTEGAWELQGLLKRMRRRGV